MNEVLSPLMGVIKLLIYSGIFIFILITLKIIISQKKEENTNKKTAEHSPIHKQKILTEHEKTMFGEIQKVLPPNYHIFVQVSFGALLKTQLTRTFWTFSQKRADYVICDPYFNVIAVIELDDNSHNGKEKEDKKRDEMLIQAGYKVLRYRYMPPLDKLKNDLLIKS